MATKQRPLGSPILPMKGFSECVRALHTEFPKTDLRLIWLAISDVQRSLSKIRQLTRKL